MYPLLLTIHNWVRWLVVLFGLYAVVRAYVGLFGRRAWTPADKTAGTLFSVSIDVQFLVGLGPDFPKPNCGGGYGQHAGGHAIG